MFEWLSLPRNHLAAIKIMHPLNSPVFCTLNMSLSRNLDKSDDVAWDEQKSQMSTKIK
jgi:hypothetical protein